MIGSSIPHCIIIFVEVPGGSVSGKLPRRRKNPSPKPPKRSGSKKPCLKRPSPEQSAQRRMQPRAIAPAIKAVEAARPKAVKRVVAESEATEQIPQSEEEVRSVQTLIAAILDHLPDMVFVKDAQDLRFVRFNCAGETLVGLSAQELLGKSDYDLFPKEQADFFTARDRDVLASGVLLDIPEEPIQTKDRGIRILHTKKVPIYDETGRPRYLLGISEDITDRKHAVDALQALAVETAAVTGEEFFQALVRQLAAAVGTRYALVTELVGDKQSRVRVLAMWMGDRLGAPFEYDLVDTPCKAVFEQGRVCHHDAVQQIYPNDKDLVALEAVAYLGVVLTARSGKPIGHLCVMDDKPLRKESLARTLMTVFAGRAAAELERRQAERAAQESAARFQIVTRATNDVIWDWDLRADTVWWSEGYSARFGWGGGELGIGAGSRHDGLHPEDRERVVDGINRVINQGGNDWSDSYRFRRRDGTFAVIFDRGVVIRDSEGQAIRMVGAMQDLTDRKLLEEQLLQAQKMDGLGRLTGGVAHDFNNLLTVICGYASLLMAERDLPDQYQKSIEEIMNTADRAVDLVKQLVQFSRRQESRPRLLNLSQLVGNLSTMLRRLIGETIHLKTDLDPGVAFVKADPGQIEQVVVNMAVNARDAMPDGGTLTIEVTNVVSREKLAGAQGPALAESWVRLTVRDNGQGIAPDIQARIFEPFFTTKEVGKGTGLGLATSYDIISRSGGTIEVESSPGQGTTFVVYLPQVSENELAAE